MDSIFDLVNRYIPPEVIRVMLIFFVPYIAYKVDQIHELLNGAIGRAETDRKQVLGETRDTLKNFRDTMES